MDRESYHDREKRIKGLWKTLDPKQDGQIDIDGLRKGLKKMDHPLKDADTLLQEVLNAVDTSGDERIQYQEFRVFVDHAERELWQLFESIDRDHNGEIDKAELQAAFSRAGLSISKSKIDQFFYEVDTNHDNVITFEEWRNFLLFIPSGRPRLREVYSYYSSIGTLNPEGDVHINDSLQGLGYFVAGGLAGIVSRTATAPLDRLKVYLIAQVANKKAAAQAVKEGSPAAAVRHLGRPLIDATKELWAAGGIRSLFAGNGLNVVKVMPESAVKFGSYEAAKRAFARLEGHTDTKNLQPWSQFLAGGIGGVVSQCMVYPLDTLKFRMQCETVSGGLHGNALIAQTAKKMYQQSGIRSYYKGLGMGLAGMFPYSAIDLYVFEGLKRFLLTRKARANHCHEEDVILNNFATGAIGAFSGAISATVVYPMNVVRTRLQAQGTILHPPTYTGWIDATRKTIRGEGPRALFKGVTPNLLKVAPSVSISYVVYENSKRLMGLH